MRLVQASSGLNGRCELIFPGDVTPLSVTARSIRARSESGAPLDLAFDVEGPRVGVRLVVDAFVLATPPTSVQITVHGGVSVHGVTWGGGRRLASTTLTWALDDSTLQASAGQPALGAVSTHIEASGARWLALSVAGVLDVSTLSADDAAWVPYVDGVALDAQALGDLAWHIVGEQTEIRIPVPVVAATTQLQFDPRRVRWKDVLGRRLRSTSPVDIEMSGS